MGQKRRLVEGSLGEAARVQGHGNEEVNVRPPPAREVGGIQGQMKKVGQRPGKAAAPTVFQAVDGVPQQAFVRSRGAGPAKRRAFLPAVAAKARLR